MANGLLLRLRERELSASPAERNVIAYVSAHPHEVVGLSVRSEIRATQNNSTRSHYQKRVCYRLAPRMGADRPSRMAHQRRCQQYQQHRGDIARSIES